MSSFCAKKQKRKLNWCHFTCSAAGTWKSSTSAFTGVLLESIYYSWAAVGTSSSLTHVMFYTGDFKSEQIVDTRVLSISEETRWWTFSEQTGPGILGVSRYFAAAHRDIRRGGLVESSVADGALGPVDPSSASARTLSVPPRSHGNIYSQFLYRAQISLTFGSREKQAQQLHLFNTSKL